MTTQPERHNFRVLESEEKHAGERTRKRRGRAASPRRTRHHYQHGGAPGVWVKTASNTDVNPVVLVATSERVALVESAATFMYDLKNSENDSEIVSALRRRRGR